QVPRRGLEEGVDRRAARPRTRRPDQTEDLCRSSRPRRVLADAARLVPRDAARRALGLVARALPAGGDRPRAVYGASRHRGATAGAAARLAAVGHRGDRRPPPTRLLVIAGARSPASS